MDMQPIPVGPDTERGYYVVWSTNTWSRERVRFSLLHLIRSDILTNHLERTSTVVSGSRESTRCQHASTHLGTAADTGFQQEPGRIGGDVKPWVTSTLWNAIESRFDLVDEAWPCYPKAVTYDGIPTYVSNAKLPQLRNSNEALNGPTIYVSVG